MQVPVLRSFREKRPRYGRYDVEVKPKNDPDEDWDGGFGFGLRCRRLVPSRPARTASSSRPRLVFTSTVELPPPGPAAPPSAAPLVREPPCCRAAPAFPLLAGRTSAAAVNDLASAKMTVYSLAMPCRPHRHRWPAHMHGTGVRACRRCAAPPG